MMILQPIIEALGSFIFAATPDLLMKFDKKIKNPVLIESFKELYAKQPLVYRNLENCIFNTNYDTGQTTGNAARDVATGPKK